MAVLTRRAVLSTRQSSPNVSDASLSVGAIVGIVIGSFCAVSILCLLSWFLRRRQRRTRRVTVIRLCCTASSDGEVESRRVSELTGSEPPYSSQTRLIGDDGGICLTEKEPSPDIPDRDFCAPSTDRASSFVAHTKRRTTSAQAPWSPKFGRVVVHNGGNSFSPEPQATVKISTGVSPWELEYHPNPVIFAHLADILYENPSPSRKSMEAQINGVRSIGHEDIAARPGSMEAVAYSQDLAMDRNWNAPPDVEEWSQSIPSVPVSGYQRAPSLEWDVDLGPNPDFARLLDSFDPEHEQAAPQQLADCLGEVAEPRSEPHLPRERKAKRKTSKESISARQSRLDDDEALVVTSKRPRRWMHSHRPDESLRQMSLASSESSVRNVEQFALSGDRETGVSSSTVSELTSSTRETSNSEHESTITSPSSSSEASRTTPASSAPSDTDLSFSCPDCELKYRTPGELRVHANRKHIRRFGCTVCGKDFNLGADLGRHIRTVHKAEGLDAIYGDGTSVLRCPNIGCRTADKVWDRKDNLARHIVRCRKATHRRNDAGRTLD